MNSTRPKTRNEKKISMNQSKEDELVLGISFWRSESPERHDFVAFLRHSGYEVTTTKDQVSVAFLGIDLFEMAKELSTLANLFDKEHGTLLANALVFSEIIAQFVRSEGQCL